MSDSNISFHITGNGVDKTVKTKADGTVDVELMPGTYTVTEQDIDRYEAQKSQRVTIVSGQTSTVTFNNKLKRGSLEVIKTSEDQFVQDMTFHLYGTSLSGLPVDEYAVTDASGVTRFENVLISGSALYTWKRSIPLSGMWFRLPRRRLSSGMSSPSAVSLIS